MVLLLLLLLVLLVVVDGIGGVVSIICSCLGSHRDQSHCNYVLPLFFLRPSFPAKTYAKHAYMVEHFTGLHDVTMYKTPKQLKGALWVKGTFPRVCKVLMETNPALGWLMW